MLTVLDYFIQFVSFGIRLKAIQLRVIAKQVSSASSVTLRS
jgi:hypothetical protein